MKFILSAHHGTGYLVVVGSGEVTFADMCGAASFAGEAAYRMGYLGLVFDLLGANSTMDMAQRYELTLHCKTQFARLSAVALVMHPEQNTGVGEQLARNEGLNWVVFPQLEEATAWLGSQIGAGSLKSPLVIDRNRA